MSYCTQVRIPTWQLGIYTQSSFTLSYGSTAFNTYNYCVACMVAHHCMIPSLKALILNPNISTKKPITLNANHQP